MEDGDTIVSYGQYNRSEEKCEEPPKDQQVHHTGVQFFKDLFMPETKA